ncbi:MAG: hypothetical protein V7K97_07015 [Nostoc sp.]|uniref:hypothetical protein n=1 Tax=Nostoc sp. TaxID=1180 RepID=UPI002FF598DA
MESIKIRTHIGDDGILQIQLPPEIANQELDVVIVFQPVIPEPSHRAKTPQELGYSHRFLENVIGSWEGEPLERPEQLSFENREEIQWPTS